ncbi:alpha/beta hydrolase [Chitinophaga defluvii]|uniref:Alpha/beta hydrolase n=1 Tax=Chitinophaga defluvii TaxID=3163343 RepID=A0ABV2T276_9BACT
MDFQPLKYVYQRTDNNKAYTLLLLPGTGGDEHDMVPLAANFGYDVNILSLRGNVLEHGMPRFFRRLSMGVFDEADLHFRTHELVHFLRNLALEKHFDVNKLIAIGYSNGANIAGAILMLYPELLAGALLFRPMQPFQALEDGFETQRQAPVLITTGRQDTTIDLADTNNYATLLSANGFKVNTYEVNAGHALTQEDITLAAQWFRDNFQIRNFSQYG